MAEVVYHGRFQPFRPAHHGSWQSLPDSVSVLQMMFANDVWLGGRLCIAIPRFTYELWKRTVNLIGCYFGGFVIGYNFGWTSKI